VNCQGNHPAFSTSCPVFQKEKAIAKIRAERAVGFPEARKLYEAGASIVTPSLSYAAAAATTRSNQRVTKTSTESQTHCSIASQSCKCSCILEISDNDKIIIPTRYKNQDAVTQVGQSQLGPQNPSSQNVDIHTNKAGNKPNSDNSKSANKARRGGRAPASSRASAGGGAVGGHDSECDMEAAELEANASTQSVIPESRKGSLSPPKLLGAAAAFARSLSKSGPRQQIKPPP